MRTFSNAFTGFLLAVLPVMCGTISIVPSTTLTAPGETISVSVGAASVNDLYAWQFDLGFDPNVLAVQNISEGPFLSSAGATLFLPGTIDNTGGSISMNAGSLFGPIAGASGSGTLATITFLVVGAGTSPLNLLGVQMLDSTLSGISAATANGSVVSTSQVPEPGSAGWVVTVLGLFAGWRFRSRIRAAGRYWPWGCLVLGLAAAAFGQVDTTPPTVVSLSFSATSLDATAGPAKMTLTAHVEDDLSGFSTGYCSNFINGGQSVCVAWNLQSGTPTDGIYTATATFPQYSAPGTWMFSIWLVDKVGNRKTLSPQDLANAGFPNSIALLSVPDLQPPRVSGLSFSPNPVDVSNGPQTVTVSLGATDDLSGINFTSGYAPCGDFVIQSPTRKQARGIDAFAFKLASGTSLDGIWKATFVMPQYSEAGNWTVSGLILRDNAHNNSSLSGTSLASALSAAGISGTLTVTSVRPDVTPPDLVDLTFGPAFVNTTTSSQTVSFEIHSTDDLSGVSALAEQRPSGTCVSSAQRSLSVSVSSPSGAQSHHSWSGNSNGLTGGSLVGGTVLAGTWQSNVVMPQFSEAGTWKIHALDLMDSVGNIATFDATQLAALGYPTQIQVIQPSGTIDGVIGPSGGTVSDQTFGARAQLTVPVNSFSTSTTVAIDVLQSPLSVPMPQGFSAAGSYFVDIEASPHPTGLLAAPGATLTIPLSNTKKPGTALTLYKVNPGTNPATLSPEPSVSGGFVVGHVNPDGISATFTGLASFSTVVGLVSNGQIPGDVNADGKLDCADVAIVKASFGKRTGQTGFDPRADINGDGFVDVNDLAFVLKQLSPGVVCR